VIEEIYAELEMMQTRVLEGLSEIPDERLDWKPTRASTSAAEITWHMASAERRLAARIRGEDADSTPQPARRPGSRPPPGARPLSAPFPEIDPASRRPSPLPAARLWPV
jgi:uncharacterized damage-inducible protein DinB